MNFKGHITGGLITGSVLTGGLALASSTLLAEPLTVVQLAQVFGVAVFFSLFPDLDISSIPQRWFFRAVFVGLLVLAYQEKYELAALLGIIAVTPVLDHHRGWTHSIFSALLIPIVLAALYEYVLSRDKWVYTWTVEGVWEHLNNYSWLVLACILGWFTHLLLDSKLKLFKNPRGHH